jgi:hypothetical protein
VRQTLIDVSAHAIASKHNPTKEHLDPSPNRIGFSNDAVRYDSIWTKCALMDVKLQIYSEHQLSKDGYEDKLA